MAIKFNRSQTFATNGTVTAAGLHNLIDGTDIYQALITDQTNLTSVGTADELLIADADLTAGDAPRAVTVQALFESGLTAGTYVGLNLSGALTYGTATGNRTVSTSATITTGTIPNLTAGTTTSTVATIPTLTAGTTTSTAANITNGTIQTLTSSTATITGGTFSGLLNSSTGTFSGSVNSTSGTIGTLNSTTGTISNFSTTLAGDFTISQGTGTLGTTGVTAGTYGTSTSAVRISIDAKGRVTSASTSEISTTPADGSITYAKLSTSTSESDNVAKRTAKAWVSFNGTGSPSIRDDFNVSTIGDDGLGSFTINFTSNLSDANYAAVVSAQAPAGTVPTLLVFNTSSAGAVTTSTPTTSSFKIYYYQQDPAYAMAVVFST